ncbi:MAG TPA: arginine deiminase [Streptosporangiaceae bacterium]|nr:arginine deiminase [Streptosporangiaceae bacterium]
MSHVHGADSEVGRLRTVLVHRPGSELRRITPRRASRLLFDTLPWVGRAQQEHDMLTSVLRDHGVEVLYVTEMLQDALQYRPARAEAIESVLASAAIGDELTGVVRGHLEGLDTAALAQVLITGLVPDELTTGRGVVFELLDRHDFILDPLPNLAFIRDSSVWVSDRVAVASLTAGRRRESELIGVIYGYHPRFAGTKYLYDPELEQVEGGDVLLLAPSVVAVGVGERTSSAGVERLARRLFDAGLAHTVLAVPLDRAEPVVHLDTVCTVVDVDTVVMYPRLAFTLTAHTITPRADGMRVSRPQPFLEAAAQAMGIDRLKVIDTGVDPLVVPRQQWDDGGNALAIDRRLVVCHERNVETNARLEAAGVQVIRVPASELGSTRGGPRCMTCPVARDPAASPDAAETASEPAGAPGLAWPAWAAGIAPAEAATESRGPVLRPPGPARFG